MAARSTAALVALAIAVLVAPHAIAQTLPRLNVVAFTLSADTLHPKVGATFHLRIIVRLRQVLRAADFVILPNLAQLQPLGDERRRESANGRTTFTETLSVVAGRPGAVHLLPAYFDAVDLRDGKPKRYSSNDLRLEVAPAAAASSGMQRLTVVLTAMAASGLLLFGAAALLARRPQPPSARTVGDTGESAGVDAFETLSPAVQRLRALPNRENAIAVRSALWRMAGVEDGAVLSHVLAREDRDKAVPDRVLRSAEVAAFVDDDALSGAINELIANVESLIR